MEHSRITISCFSHIIHCFPAHNIIETCSVGHQIVIHKTLGKSRALIDNPERNAMSYNSFFAIFLGKDSFFLYRIKTIEEIPVWSITCTVNAISALVNEILACFSCKFQVFIRIIHIPIFAPCSFIQGYPRLQSQSSPFGNMQHVLLRRQKVNCSIQIYHDTIHDKPSVITRLKQQIIGVRIQHLIIPRNIPITAYLYPIKISTHKISNTIILGTIFFIFTIIGILKIIVNFTQLRPRPTVFIGSGTSSHQYRSHGIIHQIISRNIRQFISLIKL